MLPILLFGYRKRCSMLLQIGRPYVLSKCNDYPKFQAVAIAIQRSGFKVTSKFGLCLILFLDQVMFKTWDSQSKLYCGGVWVIRMILLRLYAHLQIVLLLRLVPLLPFNMLNYLLSVTPVGVGEYMLASWLGMMVCFSLIVIE
jgi:hypothetical protein